jgi:uncharacterized protein (TIGR02246 family)
MAALVILAAVGLVARSAPTATADAAAVNSALQEYVRNLKVMDAGALAASFTNDGELLEPGMKPLCGPSAIRAFLSSFAGVRVENPAMKAESTQVCGSLALQWGTYSQTVVVKGKAPAQFSGRFAAEWRKQATGKWLLYRLMMQPVQQQASGPTNK